MRPFGYVTAPDLPTALDAVAAGARPLAGGTNLVDLMREDVERPETLVDVTALPLAGVDELQGSGGLRIGAMVRNSHLAADRLVRSRYPVLAQSLLAGASGQLRNMATVGGNLLQRTRCRRPSWSTTRCSAATAPRARSSRPSGCSPRRARAGPATSPRT